MITQARKKTLFPTSAHVHNGKQWVSQIQTQLGSNERLFILTRAHSMQIFEEIPFVKPQNDT